MGSDHDRRPELYALQRAWRDQPIPPAGPEENEMIHQAIVQARRFDRLVLLRDVVEIALAVGLTTLFCWQGTLAPTGWPWFAAAALTLSVGAFFVVDRILQRRKASISTGSVRETLEDSLRKVDHQIWLLQRVHWWYLAPLVVGGLMILAGTGYNVVGEIRGDQPPALVWAILFGALSFAFALLGGVAYWIYRMNQRAVECHLEPRREKLAGLLADLGASER